MVVAVVAVGLGFFPVVVVLLGVEEQGVEVEEEEGVGVVQKEEVKTFPSQSFSIRRTHSGWHPTSSRRKRLRNKQKKKQL